jgi:secondary thiamine-phosphate synthase enzyme
MRRIAVRTTGRDEMADITRDVAAIVAESNIGNGLCLVFVPHTTAGVTINEHADPDVADDIIMALDKLVPEDGSCKHVEGNSAAHLKASLIGSSVTVPVENGALQLGTWQGIFFCEYDGPRTRHAWVSLVPSG